MASHFQIRPLDSGDQVLSKDELQGIFDRVQKYSQAVEKIVRVAKKHRQTTAGIFSTSEHIEAVMNSKGLKQVYEQTSSEISITMLGNDSSGWQKANSPNVSNLNPEELAEIAAQKS